MVLMENACRMLVGKPDQKLHIGNLGIDGRIIFKSYIKEILCEGVGWLL